MTSTFIVFLSLCKRTNYGIGSIINYAGILGSEHDYAIGGKGVFGQLIHGAAAGSFDKFFLSYAANVHAGTAQQDLSFA
jgi:hypothetical protein